MDTKSLHRERNDALANDRRRELLKGLTKGSGALMAASIPVKALASQSVFTHTKAGPQIRCGISGMTSSIHSRDTVTLICEGYSPGWWVQAKTTDPTKPRRPWPSPCIPHQLYNVKFPKESLSLDNGGTPTLFQVCSISKFSNSDTRHWICAYLNALDNSARTANFPYSAQQVLDFYNDIGPYSYDKALSFFKTYMETHSPT